MLLYIQTTERKYFMLIYILLGYTIISIIFKYPILKSRLDLLNSLKKLKNLKIETKNLDLSKLEDLLNLFIIIDATKNNSIKTEKYSKKAIMFADMSLKLKQNIALNTTDIAIIENERMLFIKELNKTVTFDFVFLFIYMLVTIISFIYIFL